MAKQLDELNPTIMEEGLDVNVNATKIRAEVGFGSKLFEICLWILGILPGLIFLFMKTSAQKHFDQLQQKIQRNASQIDNFLEQRVMVLQNCAKLLDKAIDLDKAWKQIGCDILSPFMTMALIPLACLPELRLTDRGLVDCTTFKFVIR